MQKYLAGRLRVDRVHLKISGLPEGLSHTRLVQLSDFHYDGWRLSDRLLQETIDRSNALEPDLVLLTGDYITDDPRPIFQLAKYLKALQSKYGVYAVLGNHDLYWRGAQEMITFALTTAGIRVLWNEVVYPLGEGLAVVGLADFWSPEFQPELVFAQVAPDVPRLVLSHNPDSAAVLRAWRVDLQLSGHTHGGQVVLPKIGPVVAKILQWRKTWFPAWDARCEQVVEHWEWAEGLHYVGSNRLYTNRGLGTYLPGRLGCPPELTLFTLEPTPHKPAMPVRLDQPELPQPQHCYL
ncbi:MAG: metallophosphoesterase [Pseudanabaenaceae cyanobacterium]